jgi:glycosyltransferase involved in cell wall biosynthesis
MARPARALLDAGLMGSTRLRVALDATPLLGVRTGVGHVTAALIEHLAAADEADLVAYAITWRGRRQLVAAVPSSVTACTRRFPARLTWLLWPRVRGPKIEHWTGPVDVVHATNYVAPPSRSPVMLTVYDLTSVRFPHLARGAAETQQRLLEVAVARGALIQTSSDFVADEIRDQYGLPAERVVRIYPGIDALVRADPARGRALAGADRYVLALGTIEPRKNLPGLIRAFEQLAPSRPDLALVVAGPPGWGMTEFEAAVRSSRFGDRVHHLGYVSNTDRSALLHGAAALAYPSVYEGFGYPPLEAMQAGVPVVASSAGSLPEILGDAALLPDPSDAEAIADGLARVLDDEQERARLIALGRARVAEYSWGRAVHAYLDAYRRLAR